VEFAVGATLDATHQEIRVRKMATAEAAAEEWEEAVARKDGATRKYWFSEATNASEWNEPLKYHPVRFRDRAWGATGAGARRPARALRPSHLSRSLNRVVRLYHNVFLHSVIEPRGAHTLSIKLALTHQNPVCWSAEVAGM
jgi:hypothetical protein